MALFVEQTNLVAPALAVQQMVFSVSGLSHGAHTLTATKAGGTYMDADRFNIHDVVTCDIGSTMNLGTPGYHTNPAPGCTGTSVSGSGGWTYAPPPRGHGDINDDLWEILNSSPGTTPTNFTISIAFNGSGLDLINEVAPGNVAGLVDVAIDGVTSSRLYNQYGPTQIGNQTTYKIRSLPYGSHFVTFSMLNGFYMTADAYRVYQ